MLNLVNITRARNNLSKIIDEVFKQKKTFVLVRDSIPQAVIIPYDEYWKKEKAWEEELEKLLKKGKRVFQNWLKKEGKTLPASENEVYQLINQIAGRD